jgi:hypothetical protein
MVLIENKVLQSSIPADCAPCMKTYDLTYSHKGKDEMLDGEWKGHIVGQLSTCPPGKISLKKVEQSDFPVDIDQPDSLSALQESLKLQPRSKQLEKTLVLESPHIKMELYDDGVIDGDTVTVFINGKLVLYRQMLTEKPLTLEIEAFPGKVYELLMYADNLGSIPPNTALMVVTAGRQRYQVYLSSSEEKTAAVRFVYEKSQ